MSKALDKIIKKSASRLKDSRYQSAAELKKDLQLSMEDPYGEFVETSDEEGETKELPVIKPEQIKEYLEKALDIDPKFNGAEEARKTLKDL